MHTPTGSNRGRTSPHSDGLRGYSSDNRRDLNSITISNSLLRTRKPAVSKRKLDRLAVLLFFVFIAAFAAARSSHRLGRRTVGGGGRMETGETVARAAGVGDGGGLEYMELPQADRVKVMLIPRSWNRYDLPWFLPKVNYPKALKHAHFRVTYAPTKKAMSDGLGHSMTAINYELLVALRFGLAYSHRKSTYSSLTAVDKNAVENFFGWADGHIPRERVRQSCKPVGGTWTTDARRCVACASLLKTPGGAGPLRMKRLVNIPYKLAHKCASHHNGREYCDVEVARFLALHNQSHTVFQLPKSVCEHPTSDSDMNDSKGFFFAHYWRRHARRGNLFGYIPTPPPSTRTLRLQENRVNIAVHIRRGDFLRSDVRAKRGIMEDGTYAAVIADVIALIAGVESVFQDMPVTVHIYSEGGIDEKQPYSSHATDIQNKQYFDSTGTPRDVKWWTNLLHETAPRPGLGAAEAADLIKRATVEMHISDDTLASLHEMIAADVFVGSRSGLSTQLVWSLSRGVVLVPMSSSNSLELGKIGHICCSVPFDHDDGKFDGRRFERYWEAYSIANGPSAERAFNGVRRR